MGDVSRGLTALEYTEKKLKLKGEGKPKISGCCMLGNGLLVLFLFTKWVKNT